MWGYEYNMMGWGWMIGAVVLVVVIVIVAGVFLVVRFVPGGQNRTATAPPMAGDVQTPRQILDERYAKGDLSSEDYLERVGHLDAG